MDDTQVWRQRERARERKQLTWIKDNENVYQRIDDFVTSESEKKGQSQMVSIKINAVAK